MTILDKIIREKHRELLERRSARSIRQLESSDRFGRGRARFTEKLKDPGKIGIIAEFKRRSPSKGILNETAKVAETVCGYEKAGASGISILTDEKFFKGSVDDLETAFDNTNCPLLRKDFVIDEYQILEARAIGASAILLIASCLNNEEIKRLARFAVSLKLEVLLEVHTVQEIPDDLTNIALIGVNNRDLKDFSVDSNRSLEIIKFLPDDVLKISESGLSLPETILELKQAGFDGFLIGENFMRTDDPGAACAAFIDQIETLAKQN